MRTFDEHWEEIEEGIRWGMIKKGAKAPLSFPNLFSKDKPPINLDISKPI